MAKEKGVKIKKVDKEKDAKIHKKDKWKEYVIGDAAIEIVDGIIVKVNDDVIDLGSLEENILRSSGN